MISATTVLRVEAEGLLDYQGRAGDHFHCTVEPAPGHIRCRKTQEEVKSGCRKRGSTRRGCLQTLGIGNGVGKQGRGNQPPYPRY